MANGDQNVQISGSHTEPRESSVEVQDADSPAKPMEPASTTSENSETLESGKFSKLLAAAKLWLSDPMNIGLLLWILAVTAAGGIMFMVMVGMLDAVIPSAENRKVWLEVSNQVLNALFTLWALLMQPWRVVYLIWVCKWRAKDRIQLREVFSRAGPYQEIPRERHHMTIVVVLLNLNCLLQYCMAGVMWGIRANVRSGVLVGCLLGSAFACVAIAGLYCLLSPLGRPKPPEPQMRLKQSSLEALCRSGSIKPSTLKSLDLHGIQLDNGSTSLSSRSPPSSRSSEPRITVPIDEDIGWQGPLWGCAEDERSAASAVFCFCYAFGRNLEVAGFGNKFLHMAMLLIFLLAPFLVCFFAASQVALGNTQTAVAIILSGLVVSYLGLLYGGYWRSQLVQYFRLPKMKLFGVDSGPVGECCLWLTCCCCALCQEMRTVERYGLHVEFHPEVNAGSQRKSMLSIESSEEGKAETQDNQVEEPSRGVSGFHEPPSAQIMDT